MNAKSKSILILSDSFLARDPRVLVQIEALKRDYKLTCCGLQNPNVPGIEFIQFGIEPGSRLKKLVALGPNRIALQAFARLGWHNQRYFFRKQTRLTLRRLKNLSFDLILCNDIDALPMASKLKEATSASIYLDAHEYTPRQWDGDPRFKSKIPYWDSLLKEHGAAVDYMTTVCQSIAEEYEKEFDLKCNQLVYNAPFFEHELTPSTVDPAKIRLVHHGGLNRNRGPESMIRLMEKLDERFRLDFLLINNKPEYLKQFKQEASLNPRIRFCDPVPTKQIASRINEYDVGLFLLDPSSFNYRNALPNKFFEFIQARLAVSIWPSHEMKRIVEEYQIGVVADSFDVESAVKTLNNLTVQQIVEFKNNSDVAANIYNADESIKSIRTGVRKLLFPK